MSSRSKLQIRLASLRERFPQLGNLVANVGWLAGDRLLRMGAGVFVSAWAARYLGPGRFGSLNYTLALVTLASVPAMLGLDSIVKRELVRSPEDRALLLGTGFSLKIAAGLVIYLLGAIAICTSGAEPVTRDLVLVTGLVLLVQPFQTSDLFYQAELKSKRSVCAANIAFGLSTLLRVVLIVTGAGLLAFGAVSVLEAAAAGAVLTMFYQSDCHDLRAWKFCPALARRLLGQSLPLLLSGIAVVVYMRIDQVMLKAMLGEASVGIYSAALRFTEIWYFVPGVLATVLFPSILRSRDRGAADHARKIQRYYDLNAGLAYLIAIPGSLLAPWITHLFYGAGFAGADAILSVQIWASVFVFLGVAREQVFLAEGWTRLSLATTALGGVLNVGLNLVLIPRWGALGAAIATVVSQIVAVYLSLFIFPRTIATGVAMTRALLLPLRLAAHPFRSPAR